MNSTIDTSRINVIDSAGSQLISLVLVWGLFGLLIAQVYIFFTAFPTDRVIFKVIVSTIFALEAVQTVLATRDAYYTLVLRYGDPIALETIGMEWFSVPVSTGIIGFIAQVFYAHRIYKISSSKNLGVVILSSATVQLGSALAEGVKAREVGYFRVLRSKVLPVTAIWLLSTVICDVLIAVTMTYFLLKFRREFQHTSFPVSRLISLSVETGAITALAATATGVLFIVRRGSQSFDIPAYTLGKLYSNSLLRLLNSRILIGNNSREILPSERPEITTLPVSLDFGVTSQRVCSMAKLEDVEAGRVGANEPSQPSENGDLAVR